MSYLLSLTKQLASDTYPLLRLIYNRVLVWNRNLRYCVSLMRARKCKFGFSEVNSRHFNSSASMRNHEMGGLLRRWSILHSITQNLIVRTHAHTNAVHACSYTHTHTHTHALSLSLFLSLSLSLSQSHSLCLSQSRTHTCTRTERQTDRGVHTQGFWELCDETLHTLANFHTHTHTLSLSLSLIHTHTHTHTHTHKHTNIRTHTCTQHAEMAFLDVPYKSVFTVFLGFAKGMITPLEFFWGYSQVDTSCINLEPQQAAYRL